MATFWQDDTFYAQVMSQLFILLGEGPPIAAGLLRLTIC
jgi:hypothetical protein